MTRTSLFAALPAVLLVAALAAPAAAQSPAPAATPAATASITVSCDDFGSTPAATPAIDVAVGSAALVTLCSNPSTGYRWSDPKSSDPSIVSVGGWTYEAPAEDAPGAAGSETLTLVANAAGHATVTASYDRPWEGGEKGAWTLALDVVVRPATTADIACDQFDKSPNVTASVDAPVGNVVVLTVCSNPTTGFSWSPATSSEPSVAVPGSWVMQSPAASTDTPMAGAPTTEVLTIAADSAGTAKITASYDQPWDGGTKGAWTLELAVNVK
jgi:predicted secreted protein